MNAKHECDNCDWVGTDDDLEVTLENIPDLTQRLDAGSVVPSGECPKCGCLCYLVDSDSRLVTTTRKEKGAQS